MNLRNVTLAAAMSAGDGLIAGGCPGRVDPGRDQVVRQHLRQVPRRQPPHRMGPVLQCRDDAGRMRRRPGTGHRIRADVQRAGLEAGRVRRRASTAACNRNYWANYGGYAVPDHPQSAPRTAARTTRAATQYIKLRGAVGAHHARIRLDGLRSRSARTTGACSTLHAGQYRYIDRDNIGGVLLAGFRAGQGVALGLRARVAAELGRRRLQHRHVRHGHLHERRQLRRPGEVPAEPRLERDHDRDVCARPGARAQGHRTPSTASADARAWDNTVIGAEGPVFRPRLRRHQGRVLLQRLQRQQDVLRRHADLELPLQSAAAEETPTTMPG